MSTGINDITEEELAKVLELKKRWNGEEIRCPESAMGYDLPINVYLSYRTLATCHLSLASSLKSAKRIKQLAVIVFTVAIILMLFL